MLRRSTLIVVFLFVVLLGFALYLQRNPLSKADESAATPTPAPDLFSLGTATIVKLRIENQEGKAIELVKNGTDSWEVAPEGPAETSTVSSAVVQLSAAKILSRLEPVPALAAMGLETPVNKITIGLDDGRVLDMDIGKETPTKSGYYIRLDGGEPVVVSRYSISSILDFLENPPLSPTPEPTETVTPLPAMETPSQPAPTVSATKAP